MATPNVWVTSGSGHLVNAGAFDHIHVEQTGSTWRVVALVGTVENPLRRCIVKEGLSTEAAANAVVAQMAVLVGATAV